LIDECMICWLSWCEWLFVYYANCALWKDITSLWW